MRSKIAGLILLFALLHANSARAVVAIDTSDSVYGSGVLSVTSTYTVTGSNTLALCGTSQIDSGLNVSTMTFNAVGMTNITRVQPYNTLEFSGWYKAGVSGTHDFVFTVDVLSSGISLSCTTFTGVDQGSPVGTYQSAIAPSNVTFTVPANGLSWDWGADYLPDCTGAPYTMGGGQTQIRNECLGSGLVPIGIVSSYRSTTGDHTWSMYWVQIGAPINSATATATRRRAIVVQ